MIDFGTSTPFFFDARKEWQYYGGGLRKRGFGTSLKRAKAMWSGVTLEKIEEWSSQKIN